MGAVKPSISELIADRLDAMPNGERRAAQALVANYPLAGLRTVAEFGQAAGVSSPTILRFVARLGFQNYPEFQGALQEELAAQLQSPASRAAGQRSGQGGETFPGVEATLENIRETFRHVSPRQIAEIVALLSNHKLKAFLIGGRFTDPVARYMAAHMTIIRPNVFHVSGQESNWRDQLIDMGKRDVLLIFDIRRYQDSLIRFAEKAHRTGRSHRPVHRPVAVADRPLRPPRARRAHRSTLAVGFLGRAVRRRRDADRGTDPPPRDGQRAANSRDGRSALDHYL